ncbi:MAG: NADH-quinone oxidoreductase subunit A [Armatimonadota bacterium]|nr:NADH-quinone oxidoreductase subunit A [Armatimonadota bacterium]MDR7543041.1 NADH-quinone oxidoreductase subunit A [Armatimonadota bacterium]
MTTVAVADYLPVLVHFVLVVAFTVALLAAHAVLGGSRPLPPKLEPYESGVWTIGSSRERIPIRYYVIAMLFILFDIETVFLYPWAVIYRQLGLFGLVEMLVFVGVLGIGLLYAWKRRALEWQ